MPRLQHVHDWIWSDGWYVCIDCQHAYKETAVDIDGHPHIWFRRAARRSQLVVTARLPSAPVQAVGADREGDPAVPLPQLEGVAA